MYEVVRNLESHLKPFAMWYALYVHTKLALLIPGLLPSWKHYIPTPCGVWVRYIEDPIIHSSNKCVGVTPCPHKEQVCLKPCMQCRTEIAHRWTSQSISPCIATSS